MPPNDPATGTRSPHRVFSLLGDRTPSTLGTTAARALGAYPHAPTS